MNRIVRALCWTMACVLPASIFAAERNAAMLTTHGPVKVNGTVVPVSYPVYAGDQIATEAEGSVSLIAPGTSLLLPGSSSIRYGRQVEMTYGAVVMTATAASGMKARLGNLSVAPAGQRARFQMTSANGKLALAALNGALNVSDGTHTMVLRAGQMLSTDGSAQSEAAGVGTAAASGIPGWILGVIVVGALAAVAVTGVVTESGPPSPSQP